MSAFYNCESGLRTVKVAIKKKTVFRVIDRILWFEYSESQNN